MKKNNNQVEFVSAVSPVEKSTTVNMTDARKMLLILYKQLKQAIDQPTQVNFHQQDSETNVLFISGGNQIAINVTEGGQS